MRQTWANFRPSGSSNLPPGVWIKTVAPYLRQLLELFSVALSWYLGS